MENKVYSIYHFFAHLYRKRSQFKTVDKLGDFPFDPELLSCENRNTFPDMAIRINPGSKPPGGELIELKDSRTSYGIASFNSTIPTGRKTIASITSGKTNVVRQRMQAAGEDIYALPERDVYYLVRGKRAGNIKVCLVHGSFFQTVPVDKLIRSSFGQVLSEGLKDDSALVSADLEDFMENVTLRQSHFSKSRHVKDASVKLRFRVMTEAQKEGNILNSQQYPKIRDNTLNLVAPADSPAAKEEVKQYLRQAISQAELSQGETCTITHPFNGDFYVLSFDLSDSETD